MSFSNPVAWWGLLFMIIPLVIFLLSKKKQNIIPFGSLVFLEETDSHAAKSIFPSEWIPFLLRCLMIGLICFLLAKPEIPATIAEFIYLEEGIYQSKDYSNLVKELEENQNFQRFSFSKNEEEEMVKYFPSAWTLIDYLNANHPKAHIYTFNLSKYYKGIPITINPGIEVHPVPMNKSSKIQDTVVINRQAIFLAGESDDEGWRWNYNQLPVEVESSPNISVSVFSSGDFESEGKKLTVILEKLAEDLPITVKNEPLDKVDILFIVGDTIIDESFESRVVWNHHSGAISLFQRGQGNYEIKGHLSTANLIKSNFALALSSMLMNQIYDMNHLDLSVKRLEAMEVTNAEWQAIDSAEYKQSISKYWWLMVFIVLGMERWVVIKLQGNEE